MRLFWDLVLGPYVKGIAALLLALPYAALTYLAYDTSPWFVLSEEANSTINQFLDALPRRHTRRSSEERDIVSLVSIMVIAYLCLLTMFRVQFVTAQLYGVVDGPIFRRFFVVKKAWMRVPGAFFLIVLAVCTILVIGATNPHNDDLHFLSNKVSATDPRLILQTSAVLLFASIGPAVIFLLFGISSIKNAGGMLAETWTIFYRATAVLLTFLLHMMIVGFAVWFVLSDIAISTFLMNVVPVSWLTVILFQGIMMFTIMSSVCAALWRRYLLGLVANEH